MEVDGVVKAEIRLFDSIYKSNPKSLLIGVGIVDSKPAVVQEILTQ